MWLEVDLPFRAQRGQIDHQQIQRGDGHHARHHDGREAAQRQQPADRDEVAGLVRPRFDGGGPDQQRDDHARAGGDEADGEQESGRRQRGRASERAHDERAQPLPDRGGDHVVAERGFAAAGAARAHRQHLMAGHAEHVTETEQHGKAEEMHGRLRPRPEPDAGDEHQCRADPDRSGIIAAVDPASDLQRREHRDDGKPGSDDTEPEDREAEFERPVGGRDPDDQDQRLGQCHMSEKGDEQPVVDVAFGGDGRARLLGHRRIISRARTQLAGVRLRSLFTGWRAARKGRAVRMPPANAHAEVASRTGGVHGGNSSQISTVCAGPAVNWSRRGRFFSLIVNSTRGRRLGIMRWGGGSLSSFVWLGQCGR